MIISGGKSPEHLQLIKILDGRTAKYKEERDA